MLYMNVFIPEPLVGCCGGESQALIPTCLPCRACYLHSVHLSKGGQSGPIQTGFTQTDPSFSVMCHAFVVFNIWSNPR